jgi:hypothetical protein
MRTSWICGSRRTFWRKIRRPLADGGWRMAEVERGYR